MVCSPGAVPRIAARAAWVLGEGLTNPHRVKQMAEWSKTIALGSTSGLIDLSQGKPEHPGSQVAVATAAQAITESDTQQYSLVNGNAALRHSISVFYRKRYPDAKRYNPLSEICVTSGGHDAIFSALMVACEPGDGVVRCLPPQLHPPSSHSSHSAHPATPPESN